MQPFLGPRDREAALSNKDRLQMALTPIAQPTITVAYCSAHAVRVEVDLGNGAYALCGRPGTVARFARAVLDAVVTASDDIGPRCVFCGRRGLNQGEFAADDDGVVA